MSNRLIRVEDLLKVLALPIESVHGEIQRTVTDVAPIDDSEAETQVTFCASEKENGRDLVQASKAGIVLCPVGMDVEGIDLGRKTLIITSDPRRAFIRIMESFFSPERPEGIHTTAVIHESASIGQRVYVGPFSYIGANVSISDDTILYGHVHVYGPAMIGKRCLIHAGVVIGADGFGFWRNHEGLLEKFPHIGCVQIGDDVELGANSAVDRGTLGRTVIGNRTKIDNLVHVAHNVNIGEDCGVAAGATVCGSVHVGARTWIAPGACILDRISIGKEVLIGLGAVVLRPVPDGATIVGVPGRRGMLAGL